MPMTKGEQLKVLRGATIKTIHLRNLIIEHLRPEGWDTKDNEARAAKLLDELADMMQVLRRELL